jgi:hypothetical protein
MKVSFFPHVLGLLRNIDISHEPYMNLTVIGSISQEKHMIQQQFLQSKIGIIGSRRVCIFSLGACFLDRSKKIYTYQGVSFRWSEMYRHML